MCIRDSNSGLTILVAHLSIGIEQSRETVAGIESAQEKNDRDITRNSRWRRGVRIEEIQVDSIGKNRPVRLEVFVERDSCRMRYSNRCGKLVQLFLQNLLRHAIEKRLVEVSMERSNYRALGSFDCNKRKNRAER